VFCGGQDIFADRAIDKRLDRDIPAFVASGRAAGDVIIPRRLRRSRNVWGRHHGSPHTAEILGSHGGANGSHLTTPHAAGAMQQADCGATAIGLRRVIRTFRSGWSQRPVVVAVAAMRVMEMPAH
jgi:hypothetical protein